MSVAATRRWLAAGGIDARPGIEHDTLLMPWLIAESVVNECDIWLGVAIPDDCARWLEERAERLYANRWHFYRLIRTGSTLTRDRLASRLKRT